MFAYVSALIPNILFGFNSLFIISSICFVFGATFGTHFFLKYCRLTKDLVKRDGLDPFIKYFGLELASSLEVSIMVGLAAVLLIALVAVVKICIIGAAPLRFFKYAIFNTKKSPPFENCQWCLNRFACTFEFICMVKFWLTTRSLLRCADCNRFIIIYTLYR